MFAFGGWSMALGIVILLVVLALGAGVGLGWGLFGRPATMLRTERDAARAQLKTLEERFLAAAAELGRAQVLAEQLAPLKAENAALQADREALAALRAQADERERVWTARDAELKQQFAALAQAALEQTETRFLQRADERFVQHQESSALKLKALLQPVETTLKQYQEGLSAVEKARSEAYGELKGQIETVRAGQLQVRDEAAKLAQVLRSSPKARGRWGEQQLRNVLEMAGLSEYADFRTEVSIETSEGRLRPDAVVRVPGGRDLVIDAKCSLNSFEDAFNAANEAERQQHLKAHAGAVRAHIETLGRKAYWDQFEHAPDYVVMFIPGEHFLAAALEQDRDLYDLAFDRRVILASPTNLIAIARTVAAIWRQEKMEEQAREIGQLGKELYSRLSVMGGHVAKLGKNLDQAIGAYNSFVGSLESQVLTQAKRFEALNLDTGKKDIELPPYVDTVARPVVKLVTAMPSESGEIGQS